MGTVLFCLASIIFLFQGYDPDRVKVAFDSFVVEKLLISKMPGVIHWAVRYGSPVSLDHLLRDGANLEDEDEDEVMGHTRFYLFAIESFRRVIYQSCDAHVWKI